MAWKSMNAYTELGVLYWISTSPKPCGYVLRVVHRIKAIWTENKLNELYNTRIMPYGHCSAIQ